MRISDWSSDVCSSDLLKGLNDRAFLPMLRWCDAQGHDLTLIETMPLGMIDEDRTDRYLPLAEALDQISAEHKVTPLAYRTGGPARYFEVEGLTARLGLRSAEHTSELQSLMRTSYAVFC